MSADDDSAFDRKAFPAGFRAAMFAREEGHKAYWPLAHAGIGSFEEVAAMTEGELLAIDEIDPVRLAMIREVLAAHGYELRENESRAPSTTAPSTAHRPGGTAGTSQNKSAMS